jgi:hypothetical protein
MRKIIPLLLLLSLILTSCNFPLTRSSHKTDQVNTIVAATLNAASTPVIQSTTPSLPTVALNTLAPTITSTTTPTATTPPGDPRLTLGSPSFTDTFTNGSAFGLDTPYQDDAVLIKVENGAMQFSSSQTNAGMRWRLTSRNPKNFYLEGTFKTASCTGDDQYGLVFRAPTYGGGIGYYFGVSCDGKYFLDSSTDGTDMSTVVKLTADSHILTGSGQVNRLGAMVVDNSIKLYVNGNLIKEITDSSVNNPGYIGAFIFTYSSGLIIQMEEISLWTL